MHSKQLSELQQLLLGQMRELTQEAFYFLLQQQYQEKE
jgi:hypothetical protein